MSQTLPFVGSQRKAARTTWSARLREQIPVLYGAGQLTVSEIADLLNITPGTAAKYIADTARGRRLHDVAVLRRRGLVLGAIADALKFSDRTVAGYLIEGGLNRSSLGTCRKAKLLS